LFASVCLVAQILWCTPVEKSLVCDFDRQGDILVVEGLFGSGEAADWGQVPAAPLVVPAPVQERLTWEHLVEDRRGQEEGDLRAHRTVLVVVAAAAGALGVE